MKKQIVQFCVVIAVLVICIGGYFIVSNYFRAKNAEEESAETIEAFKIDDYTKITGLTYIYDDKTIMLLKDDDMWIYADDTTKNLDSSTIETEMLIPLSQVNATTKIENPEDISEYGFETNEEGNMEPDTNTIIAMDSDNNSYTVYIGAQNPYDTTQYYMMVEGDDNVYVIDDTLANAFSKSIDDIEEETTTEETTTEAETEETTGETTVEE